jgi:hypothetical protein
MARRPTNGKVSATVRRLIALEEGQRELTAEVKLLTEHVKMQGLTLQRLILADCDQTLILMRIETLLGKVVTKTEATEQRLTALEEARK